MSTAIVPNFCSHARTDGRYCKSPALHGQRFCYYHQRDHDRRMRLSQNLEHRRSCISHGRFQELHTQMPDNSAFDDNSAGLFHDLQPQLLDDPNAIQSWLSTMFHVIATRQIDLRAAGLLLYNLQIASGNLKRARAPLFDHERVATADATPIHRYPGFEDAWELLKQRQDAERREAEPAGPEVKKAASGTKG